MKRPALIIAVIAVVVLVGFGGWHFLKSRTMRPVATESITIADFSDESSALILIAENQGFFSRNDLHVVVKNYANGVAAIKAMRSGEADISLSTEFPVVAEAFRKENISVIACVDKYSSAYIVAMKDRGINKVSDLKGKKIGLPRGSMSEFYLGRFLDLNGMSIKDVTLVDINPAAPPLDKMTNGSMDAVVSRQMVVNRIAKQIGNNATKWPVQSGQPAYIVMTCKTDWVDAHPETIKKFLKSVAEAEDFLIHHNDEAKAIIQKRFNFDDSYMAANWAQHQFSLFIDQPLITAMKDEAKWMIRNDLTPEKQIPDFTRYLYIKGLKEVKSGAVTVIQ